MEQVTRADKTVRLTVENIGGISETSVEFDAGVNVLAGRNATNRTSLLRSIMAVLGSDDVSIKSDAEEGYAELTIGDQTYTRHLYRENGTTRMEGDPYLDDPELADLFAFLLATNETRQAVLTEQNLRELIMRPVDTDAIKDEIDTLEDEKARIDDRLDELSRLSQRLPELETKRAELEDEIDEKRAELEAKREEIEAADADVDESREEKEELEAKMEELSDVRAELSDARQELEVQRQSLEALREEKDELETDVEELPAEPTGKIDDIDAEISRLRKEKQSLQSEVSTLQQIIQFNEDNLEGASSDILDALTDGHESDDGPVTDKLLDDSEQVVCWTCGHEVDREDIEATVERLKELRKEKLSESRDIDDEIDDLENERITYQEKERQRNQVTQRLERTREQIESREANVDQLEDRLAELESEVEDIEAEVESLQTRKDDTVLSLHKEASQLEVELNRLERERDELDREIDEVDDELDTRADLEAEREDINAELEDLRTRIEQIEAEAVESFNHHMETVLDVLEYENIARIWIERSEREEREGRRKVTKKDFTLHIIRESESGTAYEDTISHLSESEREVTGLVFALAGYLVHDVHEEVPFMLLDSLEAIDSDRIARLVDYFQDYPDFLVAALLPEDAEAVDDAHPRISQI
ncbi:archaea-specific SMC-related protein [Haloarchaeobius amylolyticus]|uniref:archaea-specific SMC-related protein n=1 Tax=Haloarchaeobius amylolyticus TaxID=1198296 RepID=UPI0022717B8E|nr:archaea-specific SMC-related protein [Haloarchaeobius amylolyticus]